MITDNERLTIQIVDDEMIEITATPLMLLSFTQDLLAIAQGDGPWDNLLMPGVQLDEDSHSLLLCHVSDALARSRDNSQTAPNKLEPLQFMRGYGDLQLDASKDGLISLSLELIRIYMAGPGTSQLLPGKELGADSLPMRIILLLAVAS
jgi:hypothetical protein